MPRNLCIVCNQLIEHSDDVPAAGMPCCGFETNFEIHIKCLLQEVLKNWEVAQLQFQCPYCLEYLQVDMGLDTYQ